MCECACIYTCKHAEKFLVQPRRELFLKTFLSNILGRIKKTKQTSG